MGYDWQHITNGQSLQVRLTSSASNSTTSTATVDVGGVTADYDVTTSGGSCDTTPWTRTSPNTYTFTLPANCTQITVQAYGAGGAGSNDKGGGGGGERDSSGGDSVHGGAGGAGRDGGTGFGGTPGTASGNGGNGGDGADQPGFGGSGYSSSSGTVISGGNGGAAGVNSPGAAANSGPGVGSYGDALQAGDGRITITPAP